MRLRAGYFSLHAFIIILSAIVSGMVPAHAQDQPAITLASARAAAPIQVAQRANVAEVDGAPLVLIWARGVTRAQDVEAYAKAGLNALYVSVAGADEASLARARELLAAANLYGLPVVVGLETDAAIYDAAGRATIHRHPQSVPYQRRVWSIVKAVADELGDDPAVIGWVVEGLGSEQVSSTGRDFARWLAGTYGDIAQLNQTWGTQFEDFSEIGLGTVSEVDKIHPANLGRATLDSGFYHYWRYRGLLTLWAQAVRRATANDFIILGNQTDFRALVTLPDLYSGVVAGAAGQRFSEWGGYRGIEAIDIARQANRFMAFGFADARLLSGPILYDWAGQCLVHGAAGIALDGWDKIKGDESLQAAVKRIAAIGDGPDLFPRTPQAHIAILYEPFAGGREYGYLIQQPSNEPGTLFAALSRGTRFGSVDYLTEQMLPTASLDGYKVIFAPLAFSVSPESQQVLANYVQQGGILVADWGIGAYEVGGLNTLPQTLSELFGVGFIYAVTRTPLDIYVLFADPLFPSLEFQDSTGGRRTGGAFSGIVGDAQVHGESKRFMTLFAWGHYAPSILVNHVGAGHAVFASAALWEHWRRDDKLFEEFHYDLINRNWATWVAGGDTPLFVTEDPVLYESGAVGLFRSAASPTPTLVQIAGQPEDIFRVISGYQIIGTQRPTFAFGARGANIAAPLALQVRQTSSQAYLKIEDYGADLLSLEIHGTNPLFLTEGGELTIKGGRAVQARLLVGDDPKGYRAPAGSRHQVTLRNADNGQEISSEIITAAAQGLPINISGGAIKATVMPEGAATAPTTGNSP